jgi:hypothetical protein
MMCLSLLLYSARGTLHLRTSKLSRSTSCPKMTAFSLRWGQASNVIKN